MRKHDMTDAHWVVPPVRVMQDYDRHMKARIEAGEAEVTINGAAHGREGHPKHLWWGKSDALVRVCSMYKRPRDNGNGQWIEEDNKVVLFWPETLDFDPFTLHFVREIDSGMAYYQRRGVTGDEPDQLAINNGHEFRFGFGEKVVCEGHGEGVVVGFNDSIRMEPTYYVKGETWGGRCMEDEVVAASV
jgi:hypothetical protein